MNQLIRNKPLSWFISSDQVNQSIQFNKEDTQRLNGIGIAVSKYPDGYAINLYENPANPQFTGTITQKTPYLVLHGYWGGADKDMICLGNDKQWVYVKWFYASSKYPVGYGVNCYAEPECINYKGNIDGSKSFRVWGRAKNAIDIVQNNWIPEEHVTIKYL